MRVFPFVLLSFLLASCCLGNRKCKQDYNQINLRIISASNGEDLLFGPAKIYDPAMIRLYSMNGTDTIFHGCGAGPNQNPGGDSLLYANVDYRKFETMYLTLSHSEVDTLQVLYQAIDASPCCPDYYVATLNTCNNTAVDNISGGIAVIKK